MHARMHAHCLLEGAPGKQNGRTHMHICMLACMRIVRFKALSAHKTQMHIQMHICLFERALCIQSVHAHMHARCFCEDALCTKSAHTNAHMHACMYAEILMKSVSKKVQRAPYNVNNQ